MGLTNELPKQMKLFLAPTKFSRQLYMLPSSAAYVMDARKNGDAEFSYGSGHINPLAAISPGLVYDASEKDYVDFLCKQGYNTTTLRLVTGDSSTCDGISNGTAWDLNYPSFALSIQDGQPITGSFYRTVTNVGSPNSTYYPTIYMPSSIQVSIQPTFLSFSSVGEQKSFTVKVSGGVIAQQPIISGYITWKDGVYAVRSPIVVYTVLPSSLNTYSNLQHSFDGSSIYHQNGILGHQ